MIWIRADANNEIGMGHIMRCLSIAIALEKCNKEVCFILADENASTLLESKGQRYKILYSAYDELYRELDIFQMLILKERPEFLIIDSYYVTANYLEKLRECTNTVYIDDKYLFPYPVDMLINYNIYGEMLPYGENAEESNLKLLLGVSYVPLRAQFEGVAYSVKKQVQNVLITTGGSNKYNLTGKILKELLLQEEMRNCHYHIVSGIFDEYLPMLQKLAEVNSNIHIHQNVDNMAELMQKCDIAITAGGSTMYELCAVGVPIICFSFVDNQERIVESFVQRGLVCYGGNYLQERDNLFGNVAQNVLFLTRNKEKRMYYSNKERQLIDGKGAERIAQKLCEMEERTCE